MRVPGHITQVTASMFEGAGISLLLFVFLFQAGRLFGSTALYALAGIGLAAWLFGRSLVQGGCKRKLLMGSFNDAEPACLLTGISAGCVLLILPVIPISNGITVAIAALVAIIPVMMSGMCANQDHALIRLGWWLLGAAVLIQFAPWLVSRFSSSWVLLWLAVILIGTASLLSGLRSIHVTGLILSTFLILFSGYRMLVEPDTEYRIDASLSMANSLFRLPEQARDKTDVYWKGPYRIDRVHENDEAAWLYTDGASPVLSPIYSSASGHREKWRARFPMLSFLFESLVPDRVCILGTVGDAESRTARLFGAGKVIDVASSVHGVAHEDVGRESVKAGAGGFTLRHLSETFTDEGAAYDLILLVAPQIRHLGGIENGGMQDVDFTREALDVYWNGLSDRGVLALAVRDEAVFSRLLLTLWAYLDARSSLPLEAAASRVWAYRLDSMALHRSHVRFLLIATKGDFESVGTRLEKVLHTYPVVTVLGPGKRAVAPYDTLYSIDGIEHARKEFSRAFWKHDRQRLDFQVLQDSGPGLSFMSRDLHPWHKVMAAVGAVAAILLILFPFPDLRKAESDWERRFPSVSSLLLSGLILGSVMLLLPLGVLRFAELEGASAAMAKIQVAAWFVTGLAAGIWVSVMARRKYLLQSVLTAMLLSLVTILAMLLMALSGWLPGKEILWLLLLLTGLGFATGCSGLVRMFGLVELRMSHWLEMSMAVGLFLAPEIFIWLQTGSSQVYFWGVTAMLMLVPMVVTVWVSITYSDATGNWSEMMSRGSAYTRP